MISAILSLNSTAPEKPAAVVAKEAEEFGEAVQAKTSPEEESAKADVLPPTGDSSNIMGSGQPKEDEPMKAEGEGEPKQPAQDAN